MSIFLQSSTEDVEVIRESNLPAQYFSQLVLAILDLNKPEKLHSQDSRHVALANCMCSTPVRRRRKYAPIDFSFASPIGPQLIEAMQSNDPYLHFHVGRTYTTTSNLECNTALRLSSEPIRLLAWIRGYGLQPTFVKKAHTRWLADIIMHGITYNILPKEEWLRAVVLLERTKGITTLCTEHPLERESMKWRDMERELKTQPNLELNPRSLAGCTFGQGLDALALAMYIDEQAKKNK